MADQSLQGTWSREGKEGGREGRREGRGGEEGGRRGRRKEGEGGGRRMIGFTKLEELLNMTRAVQPQKSGTC